MKWTILLAHLLVIWTMTVAEGTVPKLKIKVEEFSSDKIIVSCPDGYTFQRTNISTQTLEYKDENSNEYICEKAPVSNEDQDKDQVKIYVKFRTCDNCIELDTTAAVGMVVGDLVATVLIGVAVYSIASQPKATLITGKKTSSKMGLICNEASANEDPIGHYQPLNKRRMDRSEYSTLPERR
ncbi:CD3gammadelta-A precursor [Salmo salar]|uniref:CD3gammadelta-A n=1 Tax=Salmo salar TaxID=8030 RepID=A3RK68_SALSA|nr:CD3gammadelta-A precursor [Salmo salar]ABO10198.1 CD3gammadelta-A [Salmo salar]ABO10200.1 CD3gammadelta-A [Salmo salar]|eukprot:NP_001117093.1 CD3gammadelta-A precursor [Salmo salar]